MFWPAHAAFSLHATVLFIYQAVVTLDREVACFWTFKCSGAPLLYFANKGLSMVLYVLSLIEFASIGSDKVSRSLSAFMYAVADCWQRFVMNGLWSSGDRIVLMMASSAAPCYNKWGLYS